MLVDVNYVNDMFHCDVSFLFYLCVCVSQHICGGQRITPKSHFSLLTM